MPRPNPRLAAPALNLTPPDAFVVALQTITPMFGGSAQTRQVDPDNPIRPASVRGHLRFWWRATAGAQYPTAEKLYKAESEMWGNTENHGKVRVEIEITHVGQPSEPVRHTIRNNGKTGFDFGQYPAYALFPFQGTIKHGKTDEVPAKAQDNIRFNVALYAEKELQAELEEALYAWIMFGGIGSRTRRGCGSLAIIEGDAAKPKLTSSHKHLTTLPSKYFLSTKTYADALLAWRGAVDVYRDFRQGVGFARNEGRERNRPGRSRYPEADTLRELTRSFGHRVIHPVRGFPRADLGLPIIFHFQGQGEPSDQTLQGKNEGKQRFASPIITKAVRVDNSYHALVAVLESPHVWEDNDLELKEKRLDIPEQDINLPQEKLAEIYPLNGLPIREAFKAFVLEEGFNEVSL